MSPFTPDLSSLRNINQDYDPDYSQSKRDTALVEFMLIIPFLVWVIFTIIVLFDVYRIKNGNLKAAYTISDMISRTNPVIDEDYIDRLKTVYDYLVTANRPTWIRVTLVQFDAGANINDPSDDQYIVKWSDGTGDKPSVTQATIGTLKDHLPVMPHGDSVLIVETHMTYQPRFNIGMSAHDLENVIVTRPRFQPPCWVSCLNDS